MSRYQQEEQRGQRHQSHRLTFEDVQNEFTATLMNLAAVRRMQLVEQMLANRAADPQRGVDSRLPPPRYQQPPGYEDERYLSEPSSNQDEKNQSSAPPPPPAPRYSRSPSPTAGSSKSRWRKSTFPDGPIIALSLDAGGGRHTMMQLDALETLMWKISSSQGYICPWGKGPRVLKPCDVFHLIVGSGTGGLIAILLGRLEMSVQAVKDFYSDNWEYIFGPLMALEDLNTQPEPGLAGKIVTWVGQGIGMVPKSARTVATERLEEKLAWIVKIRNRGTMLRHPGDPPPPLGRVIVTSRQHEKPGDRGRTVEFRSHLHPSDADHGSTIVEAARATMAHPAFFKPAAAAGVFMQLTEPLTLYPNPVSLVLEEYLEFGGRDVLVSVGAGKPDKGKGNSADEARVGRGKQPAKRTFDDVLNEIAGDCAEIERDFDEEYGRSSHRWRYILPLDPPRHIYRYFRLNHGSEVDVAEDAATVIRDIRRERIRREKERLQRDEAEKQPPVLAAADGDS